MALPAPLHAYTYAEYLALEEHAQVRHEFLAGEIYAMAGGTPEHAALAATLLRLIGNQLPEGCRTYTSDLRVRIAASNMTTYPDGSVIFGNVARASDDPLAATNPVLLVEITSSSTEAYDRGAKLDQYKRLPSVQEVLLVSHRQRHLALHQRAADGSWTVHEAGAGQVLELQSIHGKLTVDDVYRDGLETA
jgi:Uma2 family endonuclease